VIVFFLCGLWHGASWTFVVWGLWHGAFLVTERIIREQRSRARARFAVRPNHAASGIAAWPVWPHLYTLAVVMVGWVFFRADTLHGAIRFLEAMAGMGRALPTPFMVQWYLTPELWLAFLAGAIGSTPWVPALAARVERDGGAVRTGASIASTATLVALFIAAVMQMAARTYNPFIYFRF
jgi:alginate O-acetyltransferase complex protein AlgI